MDSVASHGSKVVVSNPSEWEALYRPLPFLFFGLLVIWTMLVGVWTLNTWSKRQWQTSNLQWILTAVPVLKALVLGLSFAFWYSCLHLNTCSFWVAFGVFVTRIFFETACFISFLLISHGYCIMHEQLSISERRSIAGLGSLLYLTLTGYKAAVPQFAILVVLIYLVLLYIIFVHVSRNLSVLREQLQLIQSEGVHLMQTALYTKYTMFKKFQAAMLVMVVAEVLMHAKADGVANEYWMRLLVREWTEIGIFFYIGWTFRARETTPFFTVIPTLHSASQQVLPPIYSIEMDEKDFNALGFKEWHIGVPVSVAKGGGNQKPMLVIVQNPSIASLGNVSSSEEASTTSTGTIASSNTVMAATEDQRSEKFDMMPGSYRSSSITSSIKGSNHRHHYHHNYHHNHHHSCDQNISSGQESSGHYHSHQQQVQQQLHDDKVSSPMMGVFRSTRFSRLAKEVVVDFSFGSMGKQGFYDEACPTAN